MVPLSSSCHRRTRHTEPYRNQHLPHCYKDDDVTNIIVQDVGADKDAITSLRAPTHFGRPNWDRVFSSIADKHPETDVGVVLLWKGKFLMCISLVGRCSILLVGASSCT
ncbi:hypothetical protein M378DRAFT_662315 [Amanita muscaria Koide BX008]|uniref:Ferric reductase NAD binding domain-containing protein n=1 Tax=Amanita muscaria (strain Koide BX008) TaxID=946122 RepID=A0A0C2SKB2_AMAMK|nr:hypothetical protein M378DRAFT_662315 [Amanita muscaria Koide BX008]